MAVPRLNDRQQQQQQQQQEQENKKRVSLHLFAIRSLTARGTKQVSE